MSLAPRLSLMVLFLSVFVLMGAQSQCGSDDNGSPDPSTCVDNDGCPAGQQCIDNQCTTVTEPSEAALGETCGGFAGIQCEAGLLCDFSEHSVCGADMPGFCANDDTVFCPENWDPVCGCDGETYSNECFRMAAHVALNHAGVCAGHPTSPDGCGGITGQQCSEELVCDLSANNSCGEDLVGDCVTDELIICTQQYDPVCGCDGRTYSNDCHRRAARVAFNHSGECE